MASRRVGRKAGEQLSFEFDLLGRGNRSGRTPNEADELSEAAEPLQSDGPPIYGTESGDVINGTPGDDVIHGLGGGDNILGADGNDVLHGGDGNDRLNGEGGSDVAYGGAGGDTFLDKGMSGDETFYGEADSDFLEVFRMGGGATTSTLLLDGGDGNDNIRVAVYDGHVASGSVAGGAGNDWMVLTGAVTTTVDAGDGDDVVRLESVRAGAITLGAGKDALVIWLLPDAVFSQPTVVKDFSPGVDVIDVRDWVAGAFTNWPGTNPFGTGHLRLVQSGAHVILQYNPDGAGGDWVAALRLENTSIAQYTTEDFLGWSPDGSSQGRTIIGTDRDEPITGSTGDDWIMGLDGRDTLIGLEGNDRLEGGGDDDSLSGGDGNDELLGGIDDDHLHDVAGSNRMFGEEGDDVLELAVEGSAPTQNLLDGGDGDDLLSVQFYAPGTVEMSGGAGDDVVEVMGRGNVTVSGGAGDDFVSLDDVGTGVTLSLGAGVDTVRVEGSEGALITFRVSDFQAGLGGDRLNLLPYFEAVFPTWDGQTNPFGLNLARAIQSGADTRIQVTINGAWRDLAILQNVRVSDLRPENTSGYPIDGSPPPGVHLVGEYGRDHLYGGPGDDFLEGLDGHDFLYGEAGNDRLSGGHGDDWLEGGAGDDVLDGGHWTDTLVGGEGADLFVFVRSQMLDSIRDFDPATDKIVVYDHSRFTYTEYSNGDLYLSFGNGDTLTIWNTSYSELTAANFELRIGVLPPTPIPSTPTVPVSDLITVTSSMTIAAGQEYYFAGSGFEVVETAGKPLPTLTNHGLINVISAQPYQPAVAVEVGPRLVGANTMAFVNEANGVVRVTVSGDMAAGIGVNAGNVVNRGVIEVSSSDWTAHGVLASAQGFDNTGTIRVWAPNDGAVGAAIGEGDVFNAGVIEAYGQFATALTTGGHYASVTNTGTLIAQDNLATRYSVGLSIDNYGYKVDRVIKNSGLIQGDYAIFTPDDDASPSRDLVENTGTLRGMVDLTLGDDVLTNSGLIDGDVLLGHGDDDYLGSGGRIEGGAIYLDYGDDLGEGGSQAEVFFGEEGNDVVSGGGGDDWIDGGRGADILDGGAGFDTLSFLTAHAAVTVNLATGVAVSAHSDVISGFEAVAGGRFNDQLSGDGGANRLEGREGDDTLAGGGGADRLHGGVGADTLTGGAGNDAFVFVRGDRHDVITDFVAGGADDRLVIYGYASYVRLEQIGVDTRVVLGPDDSVLLRNVSAGSLTTADFEFRTDLPDALPFEVPASAGQTRIAVAEDYVVVAGETLSFTGLNLSMFVQGLYNHGHIVAVNNAADTAVGVAAPFAGSLFFYNAPGATIDVRALGENSSAGGVYETQVFHNEGVITVHGVGSAHAGGLNYAFRTTLFNSGSIKVSSDGDASGWSFKNAVKFTNTGLIEIRAEDEARGVVIHNDRFWHAFENSGSIIVTRETGQGTPSIAITWSENSWERNFDIYNSGLIEADVAFQSVMGLTTPVDSVEVIWNTGQIRGSILTGYGGDQIHNDGSIDGRVDLENGNDLYVGLGGIQSGGVYGGDGDDRFIGGAGADVFMGGVGGDTLDGGGGADVLEGGAGDDLFIFRIGGGNDEIVDFVAGGAEDRLQIWGYTGYTLQQVGADTRVLFAGGDSVMLKGVQATSLTADDFVFGSLLRTGGDGPDALSGGSGGDFLEGGGGDDILLGGGGSDTIVGGSGFDLADYSTAASAVTLNLRSWTPQQTGGAGLDTLIQIEGVRGSAFNDAITGDARANRLEGGAGDDVLIGGAGADVISGGAGNDTLIGWINGFGFSEGDTVDYSDAQAAVTVSLNLSYAQDTIGAGVDTLNEFTNLRGSGFNDTLTGGESYDNRLEGLGGNDFIRGLDGHDVLLGGDGSDRLVGDAGDDRLEGGDGIDQADFRYARAAVTVDLHLGIANGEGADTLIGIENVGGSRYSDVLVGDGGANSLSGGLGADVLEGAAGADVLTGGDDDDLFRFAPGHGHDVITDFVSGGTQDRIEISGYASYRKVQEGADLRIILDSSNTILLKNVSAAEFTSDDINIPLVAEPSLIVGTDAGETLTGTDGLETINGLGGADTLIGNGGDDVLNGGDGNDRLVGGAGNDALNGGEGIDQADYRGAAAGIVLDLAAGTATGEGNDTLSGVENVQGSAHADSLTGDAGANSLNGHAGNDALNGAEGNDILVGGAGADALNGGAGLDYASYISATAGVGVNLTTGVHTGDAAGDTVTSVERFRLSAFADSFQGNALTNYAYGAEGNDALRGGAGFDRLYGEEGSDQLFGEADNDVLIGGQGADQIDGGAGKDGSSYETASAAVTLNLTTGVHTGDAAGDAFTNVEFFILSAHADTFTGSAAADEAQGGAGNDVLSGGGGGDWLRGQDGDDQLFGEAGEDILEGGLGADQLNGGDGIDYASYLKAVGIDLSTGVHTGEAQGDVFTSIERFRLSGYDDSFFGSAGDDWVAGYAGNDTLNGGDGNDTLNGGFSSDTLIGGNGNDKLIGELGNDTLTGGAGSDAFQYTAAGFGNDVVTDFGAGDYIRVTGIAGVDDISDLTISQNGAHTVIAFPDGSTITLNGVSAATIDAADFSFG